MNVKLKPSKQTVNKLLQASSLTEGSAKSLLAKQRINKKIDRIAKEEKVVEGISLLTSQTLKDSKKLEKHREKIGNIMRKLENPSSRPQNTKENKKNNQLISNGIVSDEKAIQRAFLADFLPQPNLERLNTGNPIEVEEIVAVLKEENAEDIFSINAKNKCSWTDYIIIAGGKSRRHLNAICDKLFQKFRSRIKGKGPFLEGEDSEEWIAFNAGRIVIHLMTAEGRSNYDLEKLWTLKHGRGLSEAIEKEDEILILEGSN